MMSARLRYSLKLEQDYLLEHPECDNVEVSFPFFENSRYTYYISRFGCTILRIGKKNGRITLLRSNVSLYSKNYTNKKYTSYKKFNIRDASSFSGNNNFKVHLIVAQMFLDKPSLFATQVDHKNGNIHDNNVSNLEWVTPEENRRRRWFEYYIGRSEPVPSFLQSETNYMLYLNSKNHVIQTKKS